MIGIIVEASSNNGELPNKILFKFGTKTCLERSLDACANSRYAHKVILSMPAQDRGLIWGTTFGDGISISKISHFGKPIQTSFYGRPNDKSERIYRAAVASDIDKIVLVEATNFLLPGWLLDAAIEASHSNDKHIVVSEPNFSNGLRVDVFPFWMLAHMMTYDIQADITSYLESNFETKKLENSGQTQLYKTKINLAFETSEQIPTLSRLAYEIDNGADLDEALKVLDEQV